MERWQRIWRMGIGPRLSPAALEKLRNGLAKNDARLIQGRTTTPPALAGLEGADVEAACAIGYAGWRGEGHDTVGALSSYFEAVCSAVDGDLGEPAACRHFLDWFDATPRETMRRRLLDEVTQTIQTAARPLAA